MATLTISDQILERLKEAAAVRHLSLEGYLNEIAAADVTDFSNRSVDQRTAAAASIQKLGTEIKHKTSIDQLIADKHAGHKY